MKQFNATIRLLLAALVLTFSVVACVSTPTAGKQEAATTTAVPVPAVEKSPAVKTQTAPAEKTAAGDVFSRPPKPLTLAQCAQCHPSQFNDLRTAGGEHRFDCRNCHEAFHAYNPLRHNYAQLMPKCSTCHSTPHGSKHTQCLSCHHNPHTPLKVPSSDHLSKYCGDCHQKEAGQLKQYPSAHTDLGCTTCHAGKHGTIPKCFDCHEPHYPKQPLAQCTTCHQVHKPLQISFRPEDNPKVCGTCHKKEFGKWSHTKSKHGQVTCTVCHNRHGFIPKCTDCHVPPHDKALLAKFPNCLTCHLDVHDLAVNK